MHLQRPLEVLVRWLRLAVEERQSDHENEKRHGAIFRHLRKRVAGPGAEQGVRRLPAEGEALIHRDTRVDRDTLLKIIEGVKNL